MAIDVGMLRFSCRCVNLYELIIKFSTIKSNSPGCDGFSLTFLKLVFPFVINNKFVYIVNTILTTFRFPNDWKLARVTPIKKHGSSKELNNLRRISFLPVLSKLLRVC